MKTFLEFIQISESIVDPYRQRLDPGIFESDSPAKLKLLVRSQIQRGIASLRALGGVRVVDYRMIGSILTHRYAEDSDIDINVLIDGSLDSAVKIATRISGMPVSGTKHVINFHVLNIKEVWDAANKDADGVFNVEENKFERIPSNKPFDVGLYWKDFTRLASTIDRVAGKLKEAVLNYDTLRLAHPNDLKHLRTLTLQKIKEIKASSKVLSQIYKTVKTNREGIFAKELTQTDLIKWGEKNRLPQNVIYKLLEKYHYLKLLHSISEIIGNDGSISPSEFNEIRQLFNPTIPK